MQLLRELSPKNLPFVLQIESNSSVTGRVASVNWKGNYFLYFSHTMVVRGHGMVNITCCFSFCKCQMKWNEMQMKGLWGKVFPPSRNFVDAMFNNPQLTKWKTPFVIHAGTARKSTSFANVKVNLLTLLQWRDCQADVN